MSRPSLLRLAVALLISTPLTLAAQQVRAGGKVVRITKSDTVAITSAKVMLHRIARDKQGPIDSAMSDPAGKFRFSFKADTAAVYLVSAGWDGIEYFSSPLHTEPTLPDTGLVLVVSDTSSTARVSTVSRHIVISRPGADGLRPALEIVVISNGGSATRIASDTIRPSWSTMLPPNVAGFTAGSGDFSSEALTVRNDSVLVFAPIAPGDKQLLYTYAISPNPGTVRIPIQDSIGTMTLLLEENGIKVKGGLVPADSQVIEGRTFRKFEASVAAGAVITIGFPGDQTEWVIPALVGGIALLLIGFAVVALRRKPPTVAVAAPSLIDQLARLDARYAGKESSTPAAEWETYQRERSRLKAELQVELARGETKV